MKDIMACLTPALGVHIKDAAASAGGTTTVLIPALWRVFLMGSCASKGMFCWALMPLRLSIKTWCTENFT